MGSDVGRYFPLAPPQSCMSEFTVMGRYRARDGWQTFTKTVEAPNEDVARERAYSLVGSQHAAKRTEMELEGVEEVVAA